VKSRFAVFMVLSVMICGGLSACGDEKKATPVETVTRNDGVAVPRSELEQICQDVVYNKAKIIKHTRESDLAKADEARAYFQSFSADLKAFQQKDRDSCMEKFDTPAKIQKYQ
jgi:hypothetical protein